MRWTQVLALGAAASIAATAACGAPASKTASTSDKSSTADAAPASAGLMPDAKGPAPEEAGAKKGGTLTVLVLDRPVGHGPELAVLPGQRRHPEAHQPRAHRLRAARRQERPGADLATDLGKASADGLDWTYTLKDGLKYEDGTPVKAEDVAYADQAVLRAGGAARRPDVPERLLPGRRQVQGPVQVR